MVFYKGLVGRIEVWEYKDRFWGVLLRHLALLPILHPPPPPTSKTQVRWLGPLLGPISSLCVQTASFLLHRRDWDQQYINMRLLEGDLGGGGSLCQMGQNQPTQKVNQIFINQDLRYYTFSKHCDFSKRAFQLLYVSASKFVFSSGTCFCYCVPGQ